MKRLKMGDVVVVGVPGAAVPEAARRADAAVHALHASIAARRVFRIEGSSAGPVLADSSKAIHV